MLTFSFTAIATPFTQSKNISNIMSNYDYLVTSHPQAHEVEFQKESLKKFKADLEVAVATASEKELKESFDKILAEIPTKEKREVYLKLLQNSSKTEIAAFLASPKLLAETLQGQSANFFVRGEPMINAMIFLFAGLIIAAIVNSIIQHAKYQFYNSYEVSGGCSAQYNDTKEALKANVMGKCLADATNPETCRHTGFSTGEDIDTYCDRDREGEYCWNETSYTCVANAKADKKVEEVQQ
jgi:hypothetical protein